MRHLVEEAGLTQAVGVESAGTGGWHVGELRDKRSREVAERRGIPIVGRARQFVAADFDRFDYVIAMDRQNQHDLLQRAPDDRARAKVSLLRAFAPAEGPSQPDVPDPYYGGPEGFDRVVDICMSACGGLLAQIRRDRSL